MAPAEGLAGFRETLLARANLLPLAVNDAFIAPLFGRILVLSLRLGIFESLDRLGPLSSGEIAENCHMDPEAASLVVSSLHAAGYLRKKGVAYGLSRRSAKWLVKSSAHYLGNFLAYVGLLHDRWAHLEKTIASGRTPVPYATTFTGVEWEIYTLGMQDLSRIFLPRVLRKITLPRGAASLLDVGGSHGLYTIEIVAKTPGLRGTIVDREEVFPVARANITRRGLGERVRLYATGGGKISPAGEKYDVLLAFNIVHGFPRGENPGFFAALASAAKPGALLYVLDEFRSERSSGVDRMLPLMVGVNLMNEAGGSIYSFSEVRAWAEEAGFERVARSSIGVPGVALLRARRRQ